MSANTATLWSFGAASENLRNQIMCMSCFHTNLAPIVDPVLPQQLFAEEPRKLHSVRMSQCSSANVRDNAPFPTKSHRPGDTAFHEALSASRAKIGRDRITYFLVRVRRSVNELAPKSPRADIHRISLRVTFCKSGWWVDTYRKSCGEILSSSRNLSRKLVQPVWSGTDATGDPLLVPTVSS